MILRKIIRLGGVVFALIGGVSTQAQTSLESEPCARKYKEGLDLFEKEKFSASRKAFGQFLRENQCNWIDQEINAKYYYAVSSVMLYNKGAGSELEQFLKEYPHHFKSKQGVFQLGRYYYKLKEFPQAKAWFEKTEVAQLSNEEAEEYYFKTGYTYFQTQDYKRAAKALYEVKGTNSKYAAPASYYFAHIEYLRGNYDGALVAFMQLKDNKSFASIVPYYILQIYHKQKRYKELIAFGEPMLGNSKGVNDIDLHHMLGNAYFRTQDYTNALIQLEQYAASVPDLGKSELYELGYSQFIKGKYQEAINNLEKPALTQDSLGQFAQYTLAASYLKMNQKNSAKNAFFLSSKSISNPILREECLFNYSKICVELNQQSEALGAFGDFIEQYPKSKHLDEINALMADIYLTTRNYKKAFEALEQIKEKDRETSQAYQKVAFYRAVELFNENSIPGSQVMFKKSLSYNIDPILTACAKFWMGECFFLKGDYAQAREYFNEFLQSPKASRTTIYNLGFYSVGYSNFKLEEYPAAISGFRSFINQSSSEDMIRVNDAYLRIADSYFVKRDYDQAISFYNKAISNSAAAADYAQYQVGKLQGLQSKNQEKVATLNNFLKEYPTSNYLDDAYFELGQAYSQLDDIVSAITVFEETSSKFPQSIYCRKALLALALINFNRSRDQDAIDTYKSIIDRFPNTEEAKEALLGLKNIYITLGRANDYLNYASTLSFGSVTQSEGDSLSYQSAEQRYMENECETAEEDFTTYLNRYPEGFFNKNAHFFRGDCYYKSERFKEAMMDFMVVIDGPTNNFTEKALKRACQISYDEQNYVVAIPLLIRLESEAEFPENRLLAQQGLMRATFTIKNYPQSSEYAIKILLNEKASDDAKQEAHFLLGKSSMEMDSLKMAYRELNIVSKAISTARGAEAKYLIAKMAYNAKEYKDAEAILLEISNQASSDYWIAKGFILLAETYMATGDNFQAKATFQSVIDNYEGEDLKLEAQNKLLALEASLATPTKAELPAPAPAPAAAPAPTENQENNNEQPAENDPNNK